MLLILCVAVVQPELEELHLMLGVNIVQCKGLVFLPLLWFDCFLKGVLCLFLERWGSVVLDVLNLLWEVNGHQQALLLVMLKLFLAAFPGLGNCQTSVFLTDLRDQ